MAAGADQLVMTFLFTDIEGSTRLWEQFPDQALATLEQHDEILRAAIERHDGLVLDHTGDGLKARFERAADAVRAAIEGQQQLQSADWGVVGEVKVRMGIHTGNVVMRHDGPFGWALNHGSRLGNIGHGGQVLLSDAALAACGPAGGWDITHLGRQRLRDVPEPMAVFQVNVPGFPREFPALRNVERPSRALPRARNAMFGRDADLQVLRDALRSRRLVTITGASGIGTTRLAAAVAVAEHDAGHDVLWCDLAGVPAESVVAAIATQLTVTLRPGRTLAESLVDWLDSYRCVLVLDHIEQSAPAVGSLIEGILDGTRDVRILCATRTVAHLRGGFVHRLEPLDPAAAAALFADRMPVRPSSESDGSRIDVLCSLVDGMPYAIEIVAARTSAFTLDELIDVLRERGLGQVAGDLDQARTVEAAVHVGVASLDPVARAQLAAATVFPGSFDREAFAQVCAPDDDLATVASSLTRLVDSSLVQREPIADRATFRLLEPVRRSVAADSDPEVVERARARLSRAIVRLSAETAEGLRGPDEKRALQRFERQIDTVRSVFEQALTDHDLDTAATIASVQWEWAFFRFKSEYFEWAKQVVHGPWSPDDPRLGPVHGVIALGCWFRDDQQGAFFHGNEAIRLEREHGAEFCLPARLAMINATVFSGADAPPADVFEQATAYHLARPELFYRMNVEAQNAIMATWMGQPDIAEHRAINALRTARRSGNPTSISYASWVLGQALSDSEAERAERLVDDALREARSVDNRWIAAIALTTLASIRRRTAGPPASARLLLDLLEELSRAGQHAQIWNALRLSALVLADDGQDELALQLAAAVRDAALAWPALPIDARAVHEIWRSIGERHGEVWTQRTIAIASTLDTTSAVRLAMAGLRAVVGDEPD